MPLKLRLKPGEKVIINGAVLSAEENSATTVILHNKAAILRARDIMQAEEANTPTKRIYFQLMCMYIDQENKQSYFDDYMQFMTDLMTATGLKEIKDSLISIYQDVGEGNLYRALKTCRAIMKVEAALLTNQPLPTDLTDA